VKGIIIVEEPWCYGRFNTLKEAEPVEAGRYVLSAVDWGEEGRKGRMAHPRQMNTPMINSKVVGATDCPVYEAIAFQTPKVAIKMVLVRRYPVTVISRGVLATGEASMSGCEEDPGCWAIDQ
jgi:hypothetical protein